MWHLAHCLDVGLGDGAGIVIILRDRARQRREALILHTRAHDNEVIIKLGHLLRNNIMQATTQRQDRHNATHTNCHTQRCQQITAAVAPEATACIFEMVNDYHAWGSFVLDW